MVHKHKHVSPYMVFNSYTNVNQHRYGPFRVEMSDYTGYGWKNPLGDTIYPKPSNLLPDGYGTYDTVGLSKKDVTVCPNRDEEDAVCKPTGNPYGVPYLADMPLVGNENRPNSLVLTACVKGYKTCNMSSGKLSCSN